MIQSYTQLLLTRLSVEGSLCEVLNAIVTMYVYKCAIRIP